jgi:hypothetical protein
MVNETRLTGTCGLQLSHRQADGHVHSNARSPKPCLQIRADTHREIQHRLEAMGLR